MIPSYALYESYEKKSALERCRRQMKSYATEIKVYSQLIPHTKCDVKQ